MQWNVPIPPSVVFLWTWFLRPALIFAGIPYLFILTLVAVFQRSLIFVPTHVAKIDAVRSGLSEQQVQPVQIQTEDGLTLNGWHVQAGLKRADREESDRRLAAGGPVWLFCPGNGGNRVNRLEFLRLFATMNLDVFLFDYRGYGDNPGSPGEALIASDYRTIWKYLTVVRGIAPERIVIYGESLGGGVGTRLAAAACEAGECPGGLVLCSTFSSLVDTGHYHYPWIPVAWLLRDQFLSINRAPRITCPVLQMHGTADTIVPLEFGKRLFEAFPAESASGVPKQFVEMQGANHNDILDVTGPEYRQAIQEFAKRVAGSVPQPALGAGGVRSMTVRGEALH